MKVEPIISSDSLQEESRVIPDPNSSSSERIDWEGLRQSSLRSGGFREERVTLWPKLLKVDPVQQAVETSAENDATLDNSGEATAKSHPDEITIQKDTDRSFVMYPEGAVDDKRDTLKDGLHKLLVSIFRKRPKLSYFQGYHDIASVIFLTLPPEVQLACMEKMSLYRLRDCMVSTLDPVVGLLRVTSNLLRLADVEYADMLHRSSPLPFYALANLMTLFSHDMPTLPLIQHTFDYLLCRPPIAVVYLTVAILLSRKPEVLRLQDDGDEGMVHSLLNALPDITEETPPTQKILSPKAGLPVVPEVPLPNPEAEKGVHEDSLSPISSLGGPDENIIAPAAVDSGEVGSIPSAEVAPPPYPGPTLVTREARRSSLSSRSASRSMSPSRLPSRGRSRSSTLSSSRRGSSEVVSSLPHLAGLSLLDDEENSKVTVPADEDESKKLGSKPRVVLSDLLRQADELYRSFPPDHPDIKISTIMGPQSVIFTWNEDEDEDDGDSGEDRDAEAEAMVLHPELIVYPVVAEPEFDHGKELGEGEVEQKERRRRRKLFRPRRLDTRAKTIVAGAIVVLGVAMAVYSVNSQRGGGGSGNIFPQAQKKWGQGRQWIGSMLAGATVRWVQELGLGGGAGDHGEL